MQNKKSKFIIIAFIIVVIMIFNSCDSSNNINMIEDNIDKIKINEIDRVIEILSSWEKQVNEEELEFVISYFEKEKANIDIDDFSIYMIEIMKNQDVDLSAVNWNYFKLGYTDSQLENPPRYEKVK